MATEEKQLCAPKKTLSDLASLGEEFHALMKKQAKDAKSLGRDTTAIDKQLSDLSKHIALHKRALKL